MRSFARFCVAPLFLFLNLLGSALSQTTYDWYDSAPDAYWKQGSGGARWTGGLWDQPPAGNILRFNNNAWLLMTNNITGYNVHQLIFGSFGTSSRTITGNALSFNDWSGADPKIENQSTGSHTISLNITGDPNDPLQINPVSGDLTISGTINNNGSWIEVYGANSKMLTLSGVVSGGGGLAIKQYSKVKLAANHTYTGGTVVEEGELWFDPNSNLSGGVTVGSASLQANVTKLFISDSDGGTTVTNAVTITNGNTSTRFIGGLNTSGENTFSGTVTLGAETRLEVASGGTVNLSGVVSGGSGLVKIGAGTAKLSGANTFSGQVVISEGTISITNANSLGTGQLNFGNAGTLTTLLVNSNTTITNTFQVYNAATNAVVNVAIGVTNTLSGKLTQDGVKVNTTKFGKDGAGTLIFNNSSSDYNGQIQIGQGTVILGANNALGTNVTTANRGVDLGLNVGDTSTTNNVFLLASNGVTVGQSVFVAAASGSSVRTIGLSGTGSATFSNEIYLDGNLTVDAGSSGTVAITGVIATNYLGAGGGIITTNGTVILSGANTYNGGTTVGNGSTLKIGAGAGAGVLGGGNVTNNGTLVFDRTGAISWANLISGTGALTKTNTGTLTLSGANTYSGDTTIQGGILQVSATDHLGASNNGVTINNGGTLRATANMTNNRNITITTGNTGYVEAAAGTTNTLKGTLSKNGSVLVLGGGGTHIVNGSITGANANSDLVVSNSTTTINSTNSYNGPTFIVAAGTLNNGATNALPTDTALTLGQAGETSSTTNRYNLNGYSQTVASVASAGSSVNVITNSTGSANLTLSSSVDKTLSNLKIGGNNFTLTKAGSNTLTMGSGNTISGISTIAVQSGTLLLGAANQISDSTALSLAGGTLNTAGFADRVGALTISGNSAISGLVAAGTAGAAGSSDFLFSSIDLSTYSGGGGSTLNLGGGYSYGQTINIASSNFTSWSGYSSGNLNTFADKIQFGNTGMKAQISFNGGTGANALTYVTAIPEPKVYVAAGILCALVALTEYRRRKQRAASAV